MLGLKKITAIFNCRYFHDKVQLYRLIIKKGYLDKVQHTKQKIIFEFLLRGMFCTQIEYLKFKNLY